MIRKFPSITVASASVALLLCTPPAFAASDGAHIERQQWSFAGLRGQFDREQLRRGFQVYQEKCTGCHGLKRVYFRNLTERGGPELDVEAVKELAKNWPNKIPDGPNDAGEMFERDAGLPDPILGPFKNDNAARAAMNGALPPDLSIIAKARNVENHSGWVKHVLLDMPLDVLNGYQEAGVDYIYALLTGYTNPPAGVKLADGMNYNAVFPGHQIAMPPPLAKDNFTTYADNTGSLEDSARDVAAFLAWTADPSLNSRKQIGWQVMIYLLVTTILLYIGKKRIWSRIDH
jgi:cytochrome c1